MSDDKLKHCNVASVMCNKIYTQSEVDLLTATAYGCGVDEGKSQIDSELEKQREACFQAVESLLYDEGGTTQNVMDAILNAKADT